MSVASGQSLYPSRCDRQEDNHLDQEGSGQSWKCHMDDAPVMGEKQVNT